MTASNSDYFLHRADTIHKYVKYPSSLNLIVFAFCWWRHFLCVFLLWSFPFFIHWVSPFLFISSHSIYVQSPWLPLFGASTIIFQLRLCMNWTQWKWWKKFIDKWEKARKIRLKFVFFFYLHFASRTFFFFFLFHFYSLLIILLKWILCFLLQTFFVRFSFICLRSFFD